ncbi:MAG: fatty acid desaturase [Gemmatimonadetes bacterium]|nr:fatty acid desaturase [Gemmatimonadota bacterium]MDA1103788.1 fatty acid desaturase [Gemmatimonadota bacterium]
MAHAHAPHDDVVYPAAIPFVITHLVCLAAIWTGVSVQALIVAFVLYVVRMWAITAGYHRYFSHRSYKTSRVLQFMIAFLGQTSAQRGVIWWSAVHRHHHLHSDTAHDVHSPRQHGFWYSHVGWIFNPSSWEPDYRTVKDLTRFPELVWLDKQMYGPAILLGFGVWAVGGWGMLVVGFFWSTVVLFHCTFFINSLAHVSGSQRYLTGDDSRNNFWLALITLGEGWHNNHHHYQSSARQGFRWWEIDLSYYVLKGMSMFRLVWDLRTPPEAIVRGEALVGRKVVEKVAGELAMAFSVESISASVREAWAESHAIEDLSEKVQRARAQMEEALLELSLPHLPTIPELREKAEEMFSESPSIDAIVNRAHELLAAAVAAHLCDAALAGA